MKKKKLVMSWLMDFSCPGGNDCGRTCCCNDWAIRLTDAEIERYKALEGEVAELNRKSINYDEKAYSFDEKGKCPVMDERGYCRLVLAYGECVLSNTCTMFPRNRFVYEDIEEYLVEICCPLVAKFLLSGKPIEFSITDTEEECEVDIDNIKLYDALNSVRIFLMNIFDCLPQKYSQGKIFILYTLTNHLYELSKERKLKPEEIQKILNQYSNQDAILGLFESCEKIKDNYELKSVTIMECLRILGAGEKSILNHYLNNVLKENSGITDIIFDWMNNNGDFPKYIKEYSEIVRTKYPKFPETFFKYSLMLKWLELNQEEFGYAMWGRIIEYLVINTCGAALIKQKGDLEEKEFSVIITCVDRCFAHATKTQKLVKEYFKNQTTIDINKLLFMTLV